MNVDPVFNGLAWPMSNYLGISHLMEEKKKARDICDNDFKELKSDTKCLKIN